MALTQVGRYRIEQEVARGGAGVVYRARDPQGRKVAVKLLSREAASPLQRRRMATEVQSLLRLRHPHVVQLLDAGEHEGTPWLAMEWIEGGTLARSLARQGPLPWEAAAQLVQRLAEALEHCHAQGVLHRDLKPGNVMLRAVDGAPLLTDFGLAKDVVGGESNLLSTMARSIGGGWLGTPGFWPPEQARGELGAIGPRSDVYGLGAVLYASLTGLPPQRGESVQELIAALERPPIPPSRYAPELPGWLEAACMQALAIDPAERQGSPAELAAQLQEGLAGHAAAGPVAAAGVTRRRLLVAAVAATGALAAGGIRLAGRRPAPERPPATPPPASSGSPSTLRGAGAGDSVWKRAERHSFHFAHTLGWRAGARRACVSLVYEVAVLDGPVLELTLLRARCVMAGPNGPSCWDTSAAARRSAPPPGELASLLGTTISISITGPGGVQGGFPLATVLESLESELAAPGAELPGWGARYQWGGWRETWTAWDGPGPDGWESELDWEGNPLQALCRRSGGGFEALHRIDAVPARGREPVDSLAHERGLLRGYLTAANALNVLRWDPRAHDLLLVPLPGSLPTVEDLLKPASAASYLGSPAQVAAGPQEAVLVHAWPWGFPLAVLPTEARYVRVGAQGHWTAVAWGGGVAYALSRELREASGELGRVTTRESPILVFDASGVDIGRQEKGSLLAMAPTTKESTWATVWFDERQGRVTREFQQDGESYTVFQEHR